MISDYSVSSLRQSQKNLLIAHIDAAIPIDLKSPSYPTTLSLLRMGLLRGTTAHSPRPRATMLTEDGRRAVCFILAHYAEALVRTGFLELKPAAGESAFDILQREKIERAKATIAARSANPQATVTTGDPDAQG